MKQRKLFAWILTIVCMVMLTATVIPHHHHHALLCFIYHTEIEMESCHAACEHSHASSDETTPCQEGCVAVFHSVTPDSVLDHIEIQGSTDVLSFFVIPILSIFLFLSVPLNTYPDKYLERLHSVCIPRIQGRRAPPFLFV